MMRAMARRWRFLLGFILFSPTYALLTYRSTRTSDIDAGRHVTRRSSLWQLGPEGWRLRFHQGTPIDEDA